MQAVATGATARVVFESRSAVYEKMGKISDALKDARKVIELAPASPQVSVLLPRKYDLYLTRDLLLLKGYIRSSRLFLLAKRPESALRVVEMASERVASDDVKRIERLASLRAEIEAALDDQKRRVLQNACHVSKLPYEVLSEIMLRVIEVRRSQLLGACVCYLADCQSCQYFFIGLTAVCTHWRSVATGTPRLWRTLRLRTRNPLKQLDLWTQRSGASHDIQGVLHLSIPPIALHDLLSVLRAWCQSPRFLQPSTPSLSLVLDEIGRRELDECLCILPRALESFTCHMESYQLFQLFQLTEPTVSLIGRLSLRCLDVTGIVMLDTLFPFNNLQSLRLRRLVGTINYGLFVERLCESPNLRELELASQAHQLLHSISGSGSAASRPRQFACLERLKLVGDFPWSSLLEWMDTPTLKYLDLSISSLDVCDALLRTWTRLGAPLSAPPLVEFRLNRCGVGSTGRSLCSLIGQLPFLERLEITSCGDDINPAIRTLAGNFQRAITVGDFVTPPLPCPRLQYIDFSRCSQVRGTSIRDLVKSRLPPPTPTLPSQSPHSTSDESAGDAPPSGDSSSPMPLQSIIIDQCPGVSADLLPWFRQRVPRVSCVYETKAQAKERMPRTLRYTGL